MPEEKAKVMQSNAHKFFWLYVVVFAVLLVVMIVFSSMSQEKLKNENAAISEQLTEAKKYSKGIKETAKDISEQNDALKEENKILKEEIETLKEEVSFLQKENPSFQENYELLQKLKEAYVAEDKESCVTLLEKIDETLIPEEEMDQFNIIKGDLT
ncbi:MAG: hypothetical protein E7399_00650 [Ruminococcaceae bacterium]|nr:hypothetical protein [Oscillospiraceae bacterium]